MLISPRFEVGVVTVLRSIIISLRIAASPVDVLYEPEYFVAETRLGQNSNYGFGTTSLVCQLFKAFVKYITNQDVEELMLIKVMGYRFLS